MRLHVLSDPMIAIIGAVDRLNEAGLNLDDATDTVLRILHDGIQQPMTDSSAAIGRDPQDPPRLIVSRLLPTLKTSPPLLDAL